MKLSALSFIAAPEEEQPLIACALAAKPAQFLNCKTLTINELYDLCHTLFSPHHLIFIHADHMSAPLREGFFKLFDNKEFKKNIYLLGSKIPPWRAHIDKRGSCLASTDENFRGILIEYAKNQGIILEPAAAAWALRAFSSQRILLFSEIDRLITSIWPKTRIEVADIEGCIETHPPLTTLFALVDAIMEKNFQRAYSAASQLLHEGQSFFALLAQLRTQLRTQWIQLQLFENQGRQALIARYPYLSAGLIDKKIKLQKAYDRRGFAKALIVLNEIEIEAKNSERDELFLIEKLLTQIT